MQAPLRWSLRHAVWTARTALNPMSGSRPNRMPLTLLNDSPSEVRSQNTYAHINNPAARASEKPRSASAGKSRNANGNVSQPSSVRMRYQVMNAVMASTSLPHGRRGASWTPRRQIVSRQGRQHELTALVWFEVQASRNGIQSDRPVHVWERRRLVDPWRRHGLLPLDWGLRACVYRSPAARGRSVPR